MRHGRALLPALAATALFLAAGCSSPSGRADDSAGGTGHDTRRSNPSAGTADRSLAVAAAPAGGTATATASPGSSGGRAHRTTLAVSSYDSKTRRAVISSRDKPGSSPSPGATDGPTVSPSPGPTGTARRTAVGDVIASVPAPGAP